MFSSCRKFLRIASSSVKMLSTTGCLPKDRRPPDTWELATGKELWEMCEYARGNDDPWLTRDRKRGPGTWDCPNIVLVRNDTKKLIGCVCNEEINHPSYMWVHIGHPKRCRCGHWFKAIDEEEYLKQKGGVMPPSPEPF